MPLWSMRKRRQQEDGLGVNHEKGYIVKVLNKPEIAFNLAEDYHS